MTRICEILKEGSDKKICEESEDWAWAVCRLSYKKLQRTSRAMPPQDQQVSFKSIELKF